MRQSVQTGSYENAYPFEAVCALSPHPSRGKPNQWYGERVQPAIQRSAPVPQEISKMTRVQSKLPSTVHYSIEVNHFKIVVDLYKERRSRLVSSQQLGPES